MANQYYKTTRWKGHKNYECLHCPFATLNLREINLHVSRHISDGIQEDPAADEDPGDENHGLDVDPGDQDKKKKKKRGK